MAKKNFDTFLNTVKSPKISAEEIEEMTREVHHKPEKSAPAKPETPAPSPVTAQKAASAPPAPRGRKPKPPEPERTIRVSVDLLESTIIELKAKVTRQQTDMKAFIRNLVERELKKEAK